jgi:integrase
MRVELKGVHTVKAKGRRYYYAWRGGPRINATPGTPAFLLEYEKAHASRRKPPENCLFTLIVEFKQSSDFDQLSARTKKDYRNYLAIVEEEFGTMPLTVAQDLRARGVFKAWRDRFAHQPRKADHLWTVLSRVLSFGKDRGRLDVNVCERGGRLYKAHRQDKIWTEDQISRFLEVASPELQLALLMALWTGQRQGDLLTLRWDAYRDGKLLIVQSKTKARVAIPCAAILVKALEQVPRSATTILTTGAGKPWTGDGFRSSWRKTCLKAEITDVTFHDLRGTAVTRLARAECSVPQIAALTGHSLKDAQAILDGHYFSREASLAEEAVSKLERKEQGTQAVKPAVKPE